METRGIKGTDLKPLQSSRTAGTDKLQNPNKGPLQGAEPRDGNFDVKISERSKELAEAREKALEIARQTPDVREERIAELKAKIASGQYKIEPENIADGMLAEAIRERLAELEDE